MSLQSSADLLARAAAITRAVDWPAFLGDATAPGLLQAAVLRSPQAHARIRSVDTASARAMPGVVAVLTADDLATAHGFGIQVHDRPPLARERVRHVGEPVAVVAASSLAEARAALSAIEVAYEPLPVIADAQAALALDAFPIHDRGNLVHERRFARGDVRAAFAGAELVVENRVRTAHQAHSYLELETALAIPLDDGRLRVLAPCQGPHAIRQELALMLDWPADRIEVVGSPLGGSYGGKDEIHAQALAALLAIRCGRPVRLAWQRAEHMAAGMKRHPFDIHLRSACNRDGRLLALEVRMLLDTGAYASHGPEVLDTAVEHAAGPYAWPAVSISGRLAYTNNGIAGAFRGFGALQINSALELQIDELARRVSMDPIAFRRRNLLSDRRRGPLGQPIAPLPDLERVLDVLERAAGRPSTGEAGERVAEEARWHRAIGHSLVIKSEGFAIGGPNAAGGRLAALGAGVYELRLGLSDMGQGLAETARRLALVHLADLPRFEPERLRIVIGSTQDTPSAGPTSASRGTHIVSRLIETLARGLSDRLGGGDAELPAVPADAPVWVEAEVSMPESFSEHGPAHAIFGACAASAEVEVDRWSGQARVRRVVVVPSVGPVVSPLGFLSQVEGSVPMAVGFVLTERLQPVDGRFGADNLDAYFIATQADTPAIEVLAVDAPSADDDRTPRGIGEIALNAIAPAIANALARAAGAMPPRLPVAAAWLRDALDIVHEAAPDAVPDGARRP